LILTLSVLASLFGTAPVTAGEDGPSKALNAADWSSIRAAYEAGRHAVVAVDGGRGYRTRNPGQRWEVSFDRRGFTVTPDGDAWTWGLELASYGRSGGERAVTAPSATSAGGGRVEYAWCDSLTEWFINDTRGLEHGYTVHKRPTGDGPLHLTLGVRGSLSPRVSAAGRDIAFSDKSGVSTVSYSNLTVLDADHTAMPARFELTADGLRLTIDDHTARYPLTIDPIAQQAYLKASNTGADDNFGASLAVSGDTVVVGAFSEDSNATGIGGNQLSNAASNAGAAYVFVRNGGAWTQQAYLKASNTGAGDNFGASVAISGDTIIVGANGEDSSATGVNGSQTNDLAPGAGAAYVFFRSGTTWTQQAYLKASNTGASDNFGVSVAVSGDTVVVGADREDSSANGVNGNQANNSASDSGAAYVFVRSGTTWTQQAYLKASNTNESDQFGHSVAVSGDTVVTGAYGEDSTATGVNGDQTNNSASLSGAAYIFVRNGTAWTQQAYLKASNTDAFDQFGMSVAASGDTVVVGAPEEDGLYGTQTNNSATGSGAAYIFVRNGTVWTQQAYLKASNTDAYDRFGASVAASGDIVVVGAPNESSSASGLYGNRADNSSQASGAAYLFNRVGSTWLPQACLKASNTGVADFFGSSVAVSGDTAVIGAYAEDSNDTGIGGNQADNSAEDAGAAYVFTFTQFDACGGLQPVIVQHPSSQSVGAGGAAAFTIVAASPGGGALNYQWRRNGVDISGATGPVLVLNAAALADNGGAYDCVVSNSCSYAISFPAGLAVSPAPHCLADLGSQGGVLGPDGFLDNNDFIIFIDAFFNHTGCP
jgi:hypothetical protein